MNKLLLLFNTVKYLKSKQIYFRLYYFLRKRYRKVIGYQYEITKKSDVTSLKLDKSIENHYSNVEDNNFSFLNFSKKFDNDINWNYNEYGKLWTYNLTYFEYLKKKEDIFYIYDFIEKIESVKDGLEPFPISLRGLSWIKFLTFENIRDKKIDDSLYAQYYILLDNLEYHLLGNHLLENGFSLLFGAYYFEDEKLYKKAVDILTDELDEQILEDGGHFELSSMYHQIMLFRVLDCINLVKNNSWKDREILKYLEQKVSLMLGWLKNITYRNGNIPLLNDSTNKIAPTSSELFEYAIRLSINYQPSLMIQSGYRKIEKEHYECVVDIGEVGASYIPGHAHADTFNFELRMDTKPFIVDSGLSTYETNETRFYERSTKAHNTIEVLDKDSSEVWGGFRVANRANIIELVENFHYLKATHDGYKKQGVLHTREWKFEENRIVIQDSLNSDVNAISRLHFHPDVTEDEIKEKIVFSSKFEISNYNYAKEFNKTEKALVLEIEFSKELEVEILI